jgi:hypothetical protein
MNARQRIADLLWWSVPSGTDEEAKAGAAELLDAYRAEVVAERDAMTVAWLVKKAREFRAMGGRERAAQADAVAAMASKLERGAVRPDNLRTLPADFFEPGHTYAAAETGPDWKFRVDTVTTHPEDGERTALGWRYFDGEWEPYAYYEDDWDVHQHVGHRDVTERGEGR